MLGEPIMHGFQRRVSLALLKGTGFCRPTPSTKTSRRYSRSQRYEAIGRAPCLTRCMAVAQSEDLWEVFGVAFQLPPFRSGDPKRMRAVVLAWLHSGTV